MHRQPNLFVVESEGFVQRILSTLFPPQIEHLHPQNDLPIVAEHIARTSRKGVERARGCTLAGAWVESKAKEKNVFHMPARQW